MRAAMIGCLAILLVAPQAAADAPPRARDLGVPFDGTPTEESIVNALVAARTMTGNNGYTVHALPHDRLQAALKKHGRLLSIERD